MDPRDVKRELDKAENVLGMVERYLVAYNESMAALHLSERVVQSPLTAAVMSASMDLQQAAIRLEQEEKSREVEAEIKREEAMEQARKRHQAFEDQRSAHQQVIENGWQ